VWGQMPTSGGMFRSSLVGVLSPSVPVRPSNSNGLVLLALVLALVLGATAIGMIWFVSGRSASATELPATDAGTHAIAACVSLAKVPALSSAAFTDRSAGSDHLARAASLARAAKSEDPRYAALSAALTEAELVIDQHGAGLTARRAVAALDNARAACAQR